MTGIGVLLSATRDVDTCVEHVEMGRLIFIVRDRSVIDVGDFVESKFVVEAQILITLGRIIALITVIRDFANCFMTGFLMITIKNSPGASAAQKL